MSKVIKEIKPAGNRSQDEDSICFVHAQGNNIFSYNPRNGIMGWNRETGDFANIPYRIFLGENPSPTFLSLYTIKEKILKGQYAHFSTGPETFPIFDIPYFIPNADATKMISPSMEGLKLFDLASKQYVCFTKTGKFTLAAWDPSGKLFAFVNQYNQDAAYIFNAETKKLQVVLQLTKQPDDKDYETLLNGNADRSYQETGQYINNIRSTYKRYIADRNYYRVYQETGRDINSLLTYKQYIANGIAWDQTSTKVVIGYFDGTTRVWDAKTGECLKTLELPNGTSVIAVAFDQSGTKVIIANVTGKILIWDLDTGDILELEEKTTGHQFHPTSVTFNLDGTTAVAGFTLGKIKEYDLSLQNPSFEQLLLCAMHYNHINVPDNLKTKFGDGLPELPVMSSTAEPMDI